MQTDTDLIVRRVLDAVPAGSYAMTALLSLLRVEVTRSVPTAAVSCKRRPVLMINPDFVESKCQSDEHLFLLVMHELHHVLLGHTRLFPRPTPAYNIAFDAVINAMLVARFPEQAYTSFFTGLYGAETGILRLLAPPGEVELEDAILRDLHRALYESNDVTAQEVFELIVRQVDCEETPVERLLGSHGTTEEEEAETSIDPALFESVRSIVERWPAPGPSAPGRALSSLLHNHHVAVVSPERLVISVMRRALLGAASRPGARRTVGTGQQRIETPMPDLRDRRATVIRSLGRWPILNASVVCTKTRSSSRADVYLDVSFSLDALLPRLYGALTALRAHVATDVHLFSTVVETVSLERLCAGKVKGTGGTDLACVLAHVAEHRPKKALVITDGYVGTPSGALVSRAGAACRDIRVLLTPGGWRGDFIGIASRIDELPSLEGIQ
jgi:hypothetical protein